MTNTKLEKLIDVVKALRTPVTGCPWDLEQDHDSLKPYLIEEAYEVLQAIESGDDVEFADELGDILLQVVLHSQLAQERKAFDIEKVITNITEKMIRRHPHVFGDDIAENSDVVLRNWEAIKLKEKKIGSFAQNLKEVPQDIPALLRAQRVGGKSSKFNFDWDSISDVLAKLKEEVIELEQEIEGIKTAKPLSTAALDRETKKKIEHELGDVLFSAAQLGRWLGVSSEDSLRACVSRFISRIEWAENNTEKALNELTSSELDKLWEASKTAENTRL